MTGRVASRGARRRRRCGATIAELVVAIGIAALLYALGGAALVSVERHQREGVAAHDGRRALREAATILVSDLRGADSVVPRGDTAVDLLAIVGTGVVCSHTVNAIVLPPATAERGVAFTNWRATAEAGDVVALFDGDAGRWWYATADSAAIAGAGACTPASGFVSTLDSVRRLPVTRLRLDRALPAGVGVGAPARVLRRGRYLLHRGADGGFALAYRRCAGVPGCGSAQPVVGPLAAAGDRGLSFALAPAESRIDVTLRAPPPAINRTGESLHVAIVMHRASGRAP